MRRREFITQGGRSRHACASYVVKILRGAKPMELPVEQATMFELARNLQTAKALAIEVPTPISLRVDEVIGSSGAIEPWGLHPARTGGKQHGACRL